MVKRLRYLLLMLLLTTCSLTISGQDTVPASLDVKIFDHLPITTLHVLPAGGQYELTDTLGRALLKIRQFEPLVFSITREGIQLTMGDSIIYFQQTVWLKGSGFENYCKVRPHGSAGPARSYTDDLLIANHQGLLQIINRVAFEKYIAGVVQAESGMLQHPEFYLVQATIARTYALRSISRHQSEGYHLCDQVHCQAYHGSSDYPTIVRGVVLTRGDVVVDRHHRLIESVYHANCGGQTVNSEDVWLQALPYLRSVTDPYCTSKRGAVWQDTISQTELAHYLNTSLNHAPGAPQMDLLYSFSQAERKHHLDAERLVPLKHMRSHFSLRSTFFSFQRQHQDIIIQGRGYGHGVGLCQEGAMRMAELGFPSDSIIGFYYQGVHVISLEEAEPAY
ncbi:MAG: SpoIID/LytB domain-containing protein [Bacteroidales bacterium]